MKQIITIIETNVVSVSASIMPLGSKGWNSENADVEYKQIPLVLTFDVSGVIGDGDDVTIVTPLLERAMDGYFIDTRNGLKSEASEGMENKSLDEKYARMQELIPEWESRTISLPIASGRKPGEASKLKAKVNALETQARDLNDMIDRYRTKVEPMELLKIYQEGFAIPEAEWASEKSKVEASLLNAMEE